MDLKFKISKIANFFFFIDNLSEWNAYCRKKYNDEWIKRYGELTSTENTALKNYRVIMKKNGTTKKFRAYFYQNNSDNIKIPFKKISNLFNKKETKIIINSFNVLQPRFEKMWGEQINLLEYNEKLITSSYKKVYEKINLAYSKLSDFYGDKSIKKYLCYVFLIISPNRGGKSISRNIISIETEKLDPKDKYRFSRLWFSVMHELTHSRFENKKYKNWLKRFVENKIIPQSELMKKRNPREVLREVITDLTKIALYHLLNKEGKIKIENDKLPQSLKDITDLDSMERIIRKELRSTMEGYLLSKRKIDKEFLEKCWIEIIYVK